MHCSFPNGESLHLLEPLLHQPLTLEDQSVYFVELVVALLEDR